MDLRASFPSLTLFADLDWAKVEAEYAPTSRFVSFPEYLSLKVEEGDCPPHLMELAFFDAALESLSQGEFSFPVESGIHLNPSACFLSLDYDILSMVKLAQDGTIDVLERRNVLAAYVDETGELRFHELSPPELEILQALEEGRPPGSDGTLENLVRQSLVLRNL